MPGERPTPSLPRLGVSSRVRERGGCVPRFDNYDRGFDTFVTIVYCAARY